MKLIKRRMENRTVNNESFPVDPAIFREDGLFKVTSKQFYHNKKRYAMLTKLF